MRLFFSFMAFEVGAALLSFPLPTVISWLTSFCVHLKRLVGYDLVWWGRAGWTQVFRFGKYLMVFPVDIMLSLLPKFPYFLPEIHKNISPNSRLTCSTSFWQTTFLVLPKLWVFPWVKLHFPSKWRNLGIFWLYQ